MSNESSREISTTRRNWMADHLGMYLRSGGAEGHIVDLRDLGSLCVLELVTAEMLFSRPGRNGDWDGKRLCRGANVKARILKTKRQFGPVAVEASAEGTFRYNVRRE